MTTGAVGAETSEPPRPGSDSTEGGGAPNDDLHDVAQGDATFLNTREFKFAGFFNRVKQAVSAQWDPNGRLRSKGKQLGMVERRTLMHVALKPDGSIADLFVAQGSGVDELDQEAMKAFEKAQPFPNPPAALVVNGFIAFEFGFLVSNEGMGGFGTPQFFRSGR
jgi:TonB family protein